ncbi:MAG TPA: hypothetical protein VI037_10435 [Nitrososphaera sp.]
MTRKGYPSRIIAYQADETIHKDEEAYNLWSRTQVYHTGADHLRSAIDSSVQHHEDRFAA